MKIAIVADSHYNQDSRFEECRKLHQWIACDAEDRGVELTLHAGDLYDRRSTPTERLAVADWVEAMAERGPFLVVRGNHDQPHDVEILRSLRTRNPVIVEEAAAVHVAAGVAVACLAWPSKASLLAATGQDQQAAQQVGADALRAVLRGLGDGLAQHQGPRILLAHAMVRGSKTSHGQELCGCDFELGLDDLALAGADFYALGHIHLSQAWSIGHAPVVYPGSPRRTSFGETEAKGYVVVEADDRGVSWQFVEVPATAQILIEAAWVANTLASTNFPGPDEIPPGCEVRFRYEVPVEHREEAARLAEQTRAGLLACGASVVKVEAQVTATTRARAPEVATARTLVEKMQALWTARAFDPGDRIAALTSKLIELEGSANAT